MRPVCKAFFSPNAISSESFSFHAFFTIFTIDYERFFIIPPSRPSSYPSRLRAMVDAMPSIWTVATERWGIADSWIADNGSRPGA